MLAVEMYVDEGFAISHDFPLISIHANTENGSVIIKANVKNIQKLQKLLEEALEDHEQKSKKFLEK